MFASIASYLQLNRYCCCCPDVEFPHFCKLQVGILHNKDVTHRFCAQIQSFASDLTVKNDSLEKGDNVRAESEERWR